MGFEVPSLNDVWHGASKGENEERLVCAKEQDLEIERRKDVMRMRSER